MSAHHDHGAHGHHDHHDHHGHHDHADHGSLKSYATGFILAVLLTVIPFWLVMGKVFDKSSTTGFVLLGLAAVQIVVHMVYFLHMNSKSEGGWTMVVVIMMSGSLWVMYHLNHNMMPGMDHETVPESIKMAPVEKEMKKMPGMS